MNDLAVMFVDDEQNVLDALERKLIREPYRRIFAASALDALEILAREPVHVIVTDMQMPGMDGLAFLRKAKDLYPEIVRLVFSGHTDVPLILETINSGEVFRYITKPVAEPAEFQAVIRQAVEYYLLRRDRRQLMEQLAERNKELEAMLAQVKQLEGLLPICVGCKKIRDDTGYWQRIEKYIGAHSQVEFSHSLCPECAHRLYSDVFPDKPQPTD
ncbi:MAG: hypothetical protein A2X46_12910 [Lentisphaerae bacterium GWF2_57_35]|nr:MAG: hypothetical protein A2X46_12910 [Lentisphaerae bacterium GWF2_57_35]